MLLFFFTFRNYEGISAGNRAWSKGLCVHWLQTEEWAFWRDNSRLNKRNHRKGKFKITLICTIDLLVQKWHIYDPAPIAVVSWSLCTAVFPTFLTIFRGLSAEFQIMQYSQTSKLIKITWLATYFQRTFIFFMLTFMLLLISHKLLEVFKHTERENKYFLQFFFVFVFETSPISHVVFSHRTVTAYLTLPLTPLNVFTWFTSTQSSYSSATKMPSR